jgi:SagB-type dehydrogenase family enzyme
LYEIDLYLATGNLTDLSAGVYHFSPHDLSLRLLRSGDFRASLVQASAGEEAIRHAPLTIICTGTYWRNSWKYQSRTYRHFGWDNGTLLANLLAVSAALGLPARVVCGFVDAEVNRLLDLDDRREVALSMIPIGFTSSSIGSNAPQLTSLNHPIVPLSANEVEYPELQKIHDASSLATADEVRQWRETFIPPSSDINLEAPSDTIEQVILRRGSSRQFKRESISLAQLQLMLQASTRGIDADFQPLNEMYVIVHAVEGLASGAYFYDREQQEFQLLKKGNFRSEAAYLGLGQAFAGDASAAIFFMADLNPILERYGNRGYRAVQLEAGIIGGRLYLAAYAQRLGATGLTFFDDDVTEFFSPHAAGKSAIFHVAVGRGEKPTG